MVVTMLQGYSDWQIICEASDGLEAVHKSGELQPDLILLDIQLPGLNGIEAARRILKTAPRSKILFLTETTSPDVIREAFRIGAVGYVVKSDAAYDLLMAMNSVIANSQFVSGRFAGCTPDRSSDA
jgi:DNA-binding NarL/FixJ family response regulator